MVFAGIVLLVIFIDQLSKFWINSRLPAGFVLRDFGLFQIVHVQNTGAAFGIFKNAATILIMVDFIGIFVILFLVLGLRKRWPFVGHPLVLAAIGLILGGTVGNLIDRLRFGQVTDFIDFKFWPVFNVSDASVTIGVIILIYCLIFLAGQSQIKA